MTKSKVPVDPLREFLEAVVTRIEALETHCGISAPASSSSVGGASLHGASSHGMQKTASARHIAGAGMCCMRSYFLSVFSAVVSLSSPSLTH
mmetsp:Transcript_30184/g.56630  ORF Transcript_30184/g.56630 Transcript_30184/m.56630 type:complete len:92 (+) Transcript_30184:123-398(+)